MNLLEDEAAQTSAELILVMGGILVIVLVAVIAYKNYLAGLGNTINGTDLPNTTNKIQSLKGLFN